MILGLGVDLCDIRRIEISLQKFGERFERRCFTDVERAKANGRAARAATFAKRFAAKEACAKALGTGMGHGVAWRSIGVVNAPGGRPMLALTDGAAQRLAALTPRGHVARLILTLTDEYPLAQAQVVLEAVTLAEAQAYETATGKKWA